MFLKLTVFLSSSTDTLLLFSNLVWKLLGCRFNVNGFVTYWCMNYFVIGEIWGFDISVAEDSGLLWCDIVSLGEWFVTFWRNVRNQVLELLTLEDECTTFLQNTRNTHTAAQRHVPEDTNHFIICLELWISFSIIIIFKSETILFVYVSFVVERPSI